jgi:TRAP-type C4-dicarboxylate transport system permease small subunit
MKKLMAPVFALLIVAGLFVEPALAQLIDVADRPSAIPQDTFGGSLRGAILQVINFFLFFLGLVATAFVIYGGFLYVTSQGEDQQVEKAKKILIYSTIGIIVVLISFALINTLVGAGGTTTPQQQ